MLPQPLIFDNLQRVKEFAMINPGHIFVKNPDGPGFIIKCKNNTQRISEKYGNDLKPQDDWHMNIKKEIVILAKSVKRNQFCIAGREIIRNESGTFIGGWVRPVSNHDEGAISFQESLLENNTEPNVLDIVQIGFKENTANCIQPENWVIDNSKWKKTGQISLASLFKYFIETPNSIWMSTSENKNCISTEEFMGCGYNSSLLIIKPEEFTMEIYTQYNPFKGYDQKKRRGVFLYKGIKYYLPITDPAIDRKYFGSFPGVNEKTKKIVMDPEKCLLCISLTSEFKGNHYKIIATIIENE